MPEAVLIAALTVPPSADGKEIRALPPAVSCLEVRADRGGDLDPDWLRGHFSGDLLYTLRSAAEGGGWAGDPERGPTRLPAAAARHDLVHLRGARALRHTVLAR